MFIFIFIYLCEQEIMMAARKGGAGSENFHLRSVLHEAQKHNVPKSLIEKAIAKATGSNADAHEEIYYEGTAGMLYMLLVCYATNSIHNTPRDPRPSQSRQAMAFVHDYK
jgi:transcriptional/translational regulatory protein YebC/TACO1